MPETRDGARSEAELRTTLTVVYQADADVIAAVLPPPSAHQRSDGRSPVGED